MKNLIVKLLLSLVLTVSTVNLAYNTYNRIAPNSRVKTSKIVEAAWMPIIPIMMLILMSYGFEPEGGGSGGGAG